MSVLRTYLRRMWRAALNSESLLTLDECVEAMPGADSKARAWLQQHVKPAGNIAGVTVYRWGDVLSVLVARRKAGMEDGGNEFLLTVETDHGDTESRGFQGQSPSVDDPAWMTVKQAAEELQLSERLVRRLLAEGTLDGAAIKAGRVWRIHRGRLIDALGIAGEDGNGLAARAEEGETQDWQEGAVLVDQVEGREGADAHPGHRLLHQVRGQASAQSHRGKARRRRASDAEEFRGWLLNTEDSEEKRSTDAS